MKICILLSGLQRNFEPFIENQLKLVIEPYDLDVFIYTSNQNLLRYYHKTQQNHQTKKNHHINHPNALIFYDPNGIIDYVKKENYENDEDFFRSKYKNLKGIYIDHNDTKFNEFIEKNKVTKHKNHTLNMVSSYFKINECIKLMEEYENKNNFKYDVVIRCRLDFFAYADFLNLRDVNTNLIYLPISKYNDHKDDSGFIMNRQCIDYFKQFINVIIEFDDNDGYFIVENQLFNYLAKKYKLSFTPQFSYRIGTNDNLRNIPFLNYNCIHKLNTNEHSHCI